MAWLWRASLATHGPVLEACLAQGGRAWREATQEGVEGKKELEQVEEGQEEEEKQCLDFLPARLKGFRK